MEAINFKKRVLSLRKLFLPLQERPRKRPRHSGGGGGGGSGAGGAAGTSGTAGGEGGKGGGGAIIESMHHHGKGVYSGTFSGTYLQYLDSDMLSIGCRLI